LADARNYQSHALKKKFDLLKPAWIWVFLDEHPDSINDGLFSTLSESSVAFNDLPASSHKGAAGFALADGHAEIKKWLEANTKRPVLKVAVASGTVAPPRFWVGQRTRSQPVMWAATDCRQKLPRQSRAAPRMGRTSLCCHGNMKGADWFAKSPRTSIPAAWQTLAMRRG
jgi:prepilin-type processing-associated H-X9-DG protein